MRTGRPRKEIPLDSFKKLCNIQCTLSEIAGFFDCSEDTVENWCKRELGTTFSAAFKKYSAGGKTSLRRMQFALAEKNAAMAIWLGKQYLGQRDFYNDVPQAESDDGFIDAINGSAKGDWKDV